MKPIMYVHRGQHRFRSPLDDRYRFYPLPELADVCCPKCRTRCRFAITPRESFVRSEHSGGYSLLALPVEGRLAGKAACTSCSNSFTAVNWPDDAYFSVSVQGGTVWAWNTVYLAPLRARIAGAKVLERQLALGKGRIHYFLARLPKWALIKRNRERLLRTIDAWLDAETTTLPR